MVHEVRIKSKTRDETLIVVFAMYKGNAHNT